MVGVGPTGIWRAVGMPAGKGLELRPLLICTVWYLLG